HGAGRGIYFAPINFLPYLSRPWQGYEMCVRETPNDVARQNAVAGFAWAMTLVNLRHPVILAAFLEKHGERLAKDDAFSTGIFSALVIWRACAPTETSISDLLQYQPDGSNPHHLWETQVRRIAEAALHFPQNDMSRVTGLFRYPPLAQPGIFGALPDEFHIPSPVARQLQIRSLNLSTSVIYIHSRCVCGCQSS